jgi:hypothetical protein
MTTKKPDVSEVPDNQTFANHLAQTFMQEQGISVEAQEDETAIEAILSISDLHADFTFWLSNVIREKLYEDVQSPSGVMLN